MREYTVYVCGVCKKESADYNEVLACEANCHGLTVEEYAEWRKLEEATEHSGAMVSIGKNEHTEKQFDDAINALIEFENKHKLC